MNWEGEIWIQICLNMPGNEDLSVSSVSALNFQEIKIHLEAG